MFVPQDTKNHASTMTAMLQIYAAAKSRAFKQSIRKRRHGKGISSRALGRRGHGKGISRVDRN
eukprot:11361170-Ditylum_brightwellii.AAC.1